MSAQKENLESIRDALAGKNEEGDMAGSAAEAEDVLDLTDKVNEDGTVTKLDPKKAKSDDEKDVLDDIDDALSDEESGDVELELSEEERKAMAEKEEKAKKEAEEEAKSEDEAPKKEAKAGKKEEDAADDESVLSDDSADAAKESLDKLKDTVKEKTKRPPKDISPSKELRSGETVEDLVVEALKPMMKDWLDENLPKLVEDIVEREIDKLMPTK